MSSSPAITLLPPNIPIGIIQSIDKSHKAKKRQKYHFSKTSRN